MSIHTPDNLRELSPDSRCLQWLDGIDRLARDGEATPELQAHLAGCTTCAQRLDDARFTRELLRPLPGLPADASARILAAVGGDAARPAAPRRAPAPRRRWSSWAAVAAAAAAFVALLLPAGGGVRPPAGDAVPVASAELDQAARELHIAMRVVGLAMAQGTSMATREMGGKVGSAVMQGTAKPLLEAVPPSILPRRAQPVAPLDPQAHPRG